jgi:hypothetical protein
MAASDRPKLAYAGIGNKGHAAVAGPGGTPYFKPLPHTPEHLALYNQLPFVLRPINNDISATERAKYRLRRVETHNQNQYVAYYLRLLDSTNTVVRMELKTVNEGVVTITPYTPNIDNLNPVPPALLPNQVLTVTGDYIQTFASVKLTLTEADIEEFINVANVIYGNENLAMITEIALCTGVDKSLNGMFNGVSGVYTESIDTWVVYTVASDVNAALNRGGFNQTFNIGHGEPLLKVQTI